MPSRASLKCSSWSSPQKRSSSCPHHSEKSPHAEKEPTPLQEFRTELNLGKVANLPQESCTSRKQPLSYRSRQPWGSPRRCSGAECRGRGRLLLPPLPNQTDTAHFSTTHAQFRAHSLGLQKPAKLRKQVPGQDRPASPEEGTITTVIGAKEHPAGKEAAAGPGKDAAEEEGTIIVELICALTQSTLTTVALRSSASVATLKLLIEKATGKSSFSLGSIYDHEECCTNDSDTLASALSCSRDCDVTVRLAMLVSRNAQAADIPGVRSAAHGIAKEQLIRALVSEDRAQIKGALISAKRLWSTDLPEYKLATQKYCELTKIPDSWDVAKMVEERKQGKLMTRAEIADPDAVAIFQRLFDRTVRMKWTRDRRDDPTVPAGYEVVKVMQVENEQSWTEYVIRQEEIRLQMASKGKARPKPYLPVATQAALHEQLPGPLLDDSVSEVFLFHGTNPIAVEKITSDNFSVNFAGSTNGTLYGRGLYFSEHCTKADEYATPDDAGLHTMLICRVTLGNVLYTADPEPDARLCEDTCMRGQKHSVLGDRIRCRDTFREFVVFDEAQIYANFVVQYKRRAPVNLRRNP